MQFPINAILKYSFPKGDLFGTPLEFTAIRSFTVNAGLLSISKCVRDEGYLQYDIEDDDEEDCDILSVYLTHNKSLIPEGLRLFTKEMAEEFLSECELDPSFAAPLAEKCIPLRSVQAFPVLPERMLQHALTQKQRETATEKIRSFLA